MKYIKKLPEPQEFTEWKKNDKMYQRGKPSWKRLPTDIRNIIRETLRKEQGYICCYCERRLEDNDYHIEHLKPKGAGFFPENQLDYDNLLCSCQFETQPGEPVHCARQKGSWYDGTLMVSPLNKNCESKFRYTLDGYIDPVDMDQKDAVTTIEKLRLGIDKLNSLRASAIEPFLADLTLDELNTFVEGYLNDKGNEPVYNEFYSTIKFLFKS
jgi:uncharacterized protein (TIGR02646 family)